MTDVAPFVRTWWAWTLGVGLVVGCSLSGCAQSDAEADEALRLATLIVARAVAAEELSYSSADSLYREALDSLDRLMESFPRSEVARKATKGELDVGAFSFEQLLRHAEQTAQKAAAESSVAACVGYLVDRLPDASRRVRLDLRRAEVFAGAEPKRTADRISSVADAALAIEDERNFVTAWLELERVGRAKVLAFSELPSIRKGRTLLEPGLVGLLESLAAAYRSDAPAQSLAAVSAAWRDYAASAKDSLSEYSSQLIGTDLARAWAQFGTLDDVVDFVNGLGGPREQVSALVEAAEHVRRGVEGELGARRLLRNVETRATEIREPYVLATVLSELSGAFADAGDEARARELLAQARLVATSLELGSSARAGVFSKLARKHAYIGDYDTAFVLTQGALKKGSTDHAWAEAGISAYFAARGDLLRALDTAFGIEPRSMRITALADLLLTASAGDSSVDRVILHRILREVG